LRCPALRQFRIHRCGERVAKADKRCFRIGSACALVLAARFRSSLASRCPSPRKRAQGKPGADRTRSLACKTKSTRASPPQVLPERSGFPRTTGYGLYAFSPVSGLSCHRCRPRTGRADGRQGRGARTVRLRRPRQSFVGRPRRALSGHACTAWNCLRPSQPAPDDRDDRASSPWWVQDGRVYNGNQNSGKAKYFWRGGLTRKAGWRGPREK